MQEKFNIQTSILLGAVIIAGSIIYTGGPRIATTPTQKTPEVEVRKSAPSEGSGKVTIVEFADFQCPYCKRFYDDTYAKIKTQYIDTGKVKFVFMHFPLSIHINAEISAEAAECANRQGKFWAYYDILFAKSQADGTNLDKASLKSYAITAGLDTKQFNACLDGEDTAGVVEADQAAGAEAGVTGTPSFFINGKIIVGAEPFSVFQSAIDSALKN